MFNEIWRSVQVDQWVNYQTRYGDQKSHLGVNWFIWVTNSRLGRKLKPHLALF